MYLKLRGTGFGNPFCKYQVPERGEIGFPAKTPHPGMLSAENGAHGCCYAHLRAGAVVIRSGVREPA